jgi:ligand-binding SRPBCC domain-containing protein
VAKIVVKTIINAPIDRVFDLARSIDLHKSSTSGTNEEAIAGKTSGLVELNDTVTWRAKHFGIYQELTVKIIKLEKPLMFHDVMQKGTFKSMAHTHSFKQENGYTLMTDNFVFTSPLGFLGTIAEVIFLKSYMKKFLMNKNKELKRVAESDDWKAVLNIEI